MSSFADLQAKLDELQGNIQKRNLTSVAAVANVASTVARAGKGGSGAGRPPLAAKRASSRGGGSLQWEGTKSYLADRKGH